MVRMLSKAAAGALLLAAGPLAHALTLPTASFADLGQALQAYLAQVGVTAPAQACMAIANPIDGD